MTITLATARAIIAAGLAEGHRMGLQPLSVVVLDAGGHVTAFEREDGASNARFQIAFGKANGALALGIGSGFRPDLMAFLFPLWLIATCIGTRSWRALLGGAAILAGTAAIWVSALVIAMGGIQTFQSMLFRRAPLPQQRKYNHST